MEQLFEVLWGSYADKYIRQFGAAKRYEAVMKAFVRNDMKQFETTGIFID